jgi:aldose 1-epimerase
MLSRTVLPLIALLVSGFAQASTAGPDANGKYTIAAPGIRANFVPYGASISNLFINDTHGVERDIVMGFDNATYYSVDRQHPHLGGVPGRYANRIKNSTFELDGETFHTTPNEFPEPGYPNGTDTLHGGPDGWDWRNWTVVAHTESSITFSLVDPDGKEGFPGEVISYVTYTLTANTWNFKMVAIPTTKKTPIMLSSHTYWNLDGFQNPDTPLVLNHSLWLPYSGQRIDVDGDLIPTGNILANHQGDVNDFWSTPKQIGANFSSPDLLGNCGTGCLGYGEYS